MIEFRRWSKFAGKRVSTKPVKQMVYIAAEENINKLYSKNSSAIDVGCAEMKTRPLYDKYKYTGVDLSEEKLIEGKNKYPDAEYIVSDLGELNKNKKAELVGCFQMIGINSLFDETYQSSLESIKDLYQHVDDGGDLVFNIGEKSFNEKQEIRLFLLDRFDNVRIIKCGFINKSVKFDLLSYSLAKIALISPKLTQAFETQYYLFICEGKKV